MSPEWLQVALAIGGVVVGGVSGLVTGVWKAARIEQEVRRDLTQDLAEAVQEMNVKLLKIADQFDETLRALRQKINDVELETQKHFVSKPEFDDFRREYREDMRDLKHSIAELMRNRQ